MEKHCEYCGMPIRLACGREACTKRRESMYLKLYDGRTKDEADKLARKIRTEEAKLRKLGGNGNYSDVQVRATFERPHGSKEYGVFVLKG